MASSLNHTQHLLNVNFISVNVELQINHEKQIKDLNRGNNFSNGTVKMIVSGNTEREREDPKKSWDAAKRYVQKGFDGVDESKMRTKYNKNSLSL